MPFDIDLPYPKISLVTATTQLSIVAVDPNRYLFGSVYQINLLASNVGVGDVVLFDKTNATLVTENNTTYFIINESDIQFIENYIAP